MNPVFPSGTDTEYSGLVKLGARSATVSTKTVTRLSEQLGTADGSDARI